MDTYEYESVLLVKNEVFVFKIPPRTTSRGYRAADWNLQEPQWTGRMRLLTKGNECYIKLEDKLTGQLFAKCPVETYPGVAIEAVTDSSRYFVLRIQDDNGRTAFIGLGFGDRSDSFDLNVALQDHFKWLKKEKEAEHAPLAPGQDYSFKEGETIKINMKITKKDGSEGNSKSKSRSTVGGGALGGGLLPPPPGAPRIPPPSPQHTAPPNSGQGTDWSDYSGSSSATPANQQQQQQASTNNSSWVQF